MGIGSSAGGPRVELEGETFAFCSVGCREKFIADPARYLTSAAARTGADAADAADTGGEPGGGAGGYSGMEYTCPMHPQIRRPGPGSCPICGMALEPVVVTVDSGPNPELADMTRRFWVGVALTVPVVLLEMGRDLVGGVADLVSRRPRGGSSWCWPRRWCCGRGGRSSSAAGTRCGPGT